MGKFTTEEAINYLVAKSRKPGVPMGKSFAFSSHPNLMKATILSDGSVNVEGWISTSHKDLEKDILEPESFSPALSAYMERGAPISIEHGIKTLPVGFLQRAVLVRDGNILEAVDNPKHEKGEFKHFKDMLSDGGTGWYGLGNVYDQKAAFGIVKGTVSSFSWIGKPQKWRDQPDGGRHFLEAGAIDPLIEVTVAAYPINTHAAMKIAASLGYTTEINLRELYVDPLILETVIEILVEPGTSSGAVEEVVAEHNSHYRVEKKLTDYFKPYRKK